MRDRRSRISRVSEAAISAATRAHESTGVKPLLLVGDFRRRVEPPKL